MKIEPNDIIYARCTYNSTEKNEATFIGSTSDDEMCNFYMMYYIKNPYLSTDSMLPMLPFSQYRSTELVDCKRMDKFKVNLPEGNDVPLPRNITMEESAIGQNSNHHHHKNFNDDLKKKFQYEQDSMWPMEKPEFGQITAVDFDSKGNIVIFHRGNHVWNQLSFDFNNNYRRVRDGPISLPTIVTIDSKTKQILDSWGENLFFLPHGLTIDHQNKSIWLTDVALHQVFKYSIDPDSKNYRKSLITLGERFKPGNDNKHFCKPTSVAIDYLNGDIYVADGYCNSRIIRFDYQGQYQNHWGHRNMMSMLIIIMVFLLIFFLILSLVGFDQNSLNVPHKVILINQDEKLACVADRENGRIVCFLTPYGQYRFEISIPQFVGRVFSISYSPIDNILYAINGQILVDKSEINSGTYIIGFAFDFQTLKLISTFAPKKTYVSNGII